MHRCESNNGWGSRVPGAGSLGGKISAPTPPPPPTEWGPETAGKQVPLSAWRLPKGARKHQVSPGNGATSGHKPMWRKFPKHPSFEHKSTQLCSWRPQARWARPAPRASQRRLYSGRRGARAGRLGSQVAAAREAVTFKHKGRDGKGRIRKNYWHGNCFLYKCSF